MHHNPFFNLFTLHNNSLDNKESKINRNVFLRFYILPTTYVYMIYNSKFVCPFFYTCHCM